MSPTILEKLAEHMGISNSRLISRIVEPFPCSALVYYLQNILSVYSRMNSERVSHILPFCFLLDLFGFVEAIQAYIYPSMVEGKPNLL